MSKNIKFNPNSAFEAMVSVPSTPKGKAPKTALKDNKPKLIQTGFYITEKQHYALKMKALTDNKDMSRLLRDMLDKNLKDYLK